MHDHLRRLVDPASMPAHGLQQPLGREHRHLRVIGDRASAAIGDVEARDALLSVAPADLRATQELDGRAERIADGAAEEAAAEALA